MRTALTRDYKATVVARIQRDRKFARALYDEALSAGLEDTIPLGLNSGGLARELSVRNSMPNAWRL